MSRPFPTIRKRPAMLRILLPYVMHVHDQLEQLSTLPDEETARWPTVTSIMGAGGTLRQLWDYFVEKVAVISAVFILVILTADLLFRPICWAARLSGVLRCQIIL